MLTEGADELVPEPDEEPEEVPFVPEELVPEPDEPLPVSDDVVPELEPVVPLLLLEPLLHTLEPPAIFELSEADDPVLEDATDFFAVAFELDLPSAGS